MPKGSYSELLEALSRVVHQLRTEKGFTQVELAKKAGRSQSSIARVEGNPPEEISLKVAFLHFADSRLSMV